MLFTAHLLGGAASGLAVGRGRAVAFTVGLAGHAVLDAAPHFDNPTALHAVGDFALGAVAFRAAAAALRRTLPRRYGEALWGGLGAVLPDVETVLIHLGWMPKAWALYPSHSGLTPHGHLGPPWGWLAQVPVVLLGVWALRRAGRTGAPGTAP